MMEREIINSGTALTGDQKKDEEAFIEKMKEEYLEEEKKQELKRLSEVAVQRHFRKTELTKEEESLLEEISREEYNEYN